MLLNLSGSISPLIPYSDDPSVLSVSSWSKNSDEAKPIAINNGYSGSNATGAAGIRPILLPPEDRSKQHLFVHIGKAGGSSIQVMVKNARKICIKLNAQNVEGEKELVRSQVCAISKIPDGRVHLKDRLHPEIFYSKYTQFLINLRDPIDRLFSWYNYELTSYVYEPRWSTANQTGQASDNFRRLTQECFPGNENENGFIQMVNGGLMSPEAESTNETGGDAAPSCDKLARLCLRGDIMCFGHNYYNYEVYLEEILLRKGLSHQSDRNERIRIDVIRSEYSMDDFNTTIGLWTSDSIQDYWNNYPGVTPDVQSLYGRQRSIEKYKKSRNAKQTSKPKVLSPEARTALCKHICIELVVYKIALGAADNLDDSDVKTSFDALDENCGFRVDEVCGTTWTFRDVKAQKKVFEAPW